MADIARNARAGSQMKAAGMIDALDMQFGGKAFLGEKVVRHVGNAGPG